MTAYFIMGDHLPSVTVFRGKLVGSVAPVYDPTHSTQETFDMALDKEQVLNQLRKVNDPELHRDIVTLNMVKNVAVCDGNVAIKVELTTPACPLKDEIEADVRQAVEELDGVENVEVEFTADVKKANPQQQAAENNPLPNVKNIIAVGAGKGGVGKSVVAVNLAVGLARQGAAVGLMDGDIYGPSVPTMLGLDDMQAKGSDDQIMPFEVHGLKTMTIGKLVDPDKPLIWRGPMAHGAFRQLATQTQWGELDYLVIDLPPGTGDVPLTMSQLLPLTGAVVVCTPQKVAQDDARRAIAMFKQLNVPLLGIVENMSYFVCDHGDEHDIFGRGGAAKLAGSFGAPLLGTIPIHTALRKNSDAGNPTANYEDGGPLAEELTDMVQATAAEISKQAMSDEMVQPTISVT